MNFAKAAWTRGAVMTVALLACAASPLGAQVRTVDPNVAIDADLAPGAQDQATYGTDSYGSGTTYAPPPPEQNTTVSDDVTPPAAQQQVPQQSYGSVADQAPAQPTYAPPAQATSAAPVARAQAAADDTAYQEDDLIGAAEGVFGKGAQGLAQIIEKILAEQGRPNAYITGREAAGAFVVGLRYGSGTLFHKVEGKRDVYWTGPSVGFDVGGDAAKTFVLVYNLYDSQDLFKRFPAGEGAAYLVGGFTASYLRRGNIVLIPIRLGVGYRLGANIGYMKFTEEQKWLPF